MPRISDWTIDGAGGQPILGNCHAPDDVPRSVVVIAHGFKGYKDYGMFLRMAHTLAEAGFIAHRFNFSHSGMTNNIDTFERPDLFEQDTWNKQVADLSAIVDAIRNGELPGRDLPLFMLGHSRGGVSVLLYAGRSADDANVAMNPAGVITLAAPATCSVFSDEDREALRERGWIESPSSRTGQVLRVGRQYLDEIEQQPKAHDLLLQVSRIQCPLLIIHGATDPTVDAACAERIANAVATRPQVVIIDGADHVFNTPNPFPMDGEPSAELASALDAIVGFCRGAIEP